MALAAISYIVIVSLILCVYMYLRKDLVNARIFWRGMWWCTWHVFIPSQNKAQCLRIWLSLNGRGARFSISTTL